MPRLSLLCTVAVLAACGESSPQLDWPLDRPLPSREGQRLPLPAWETAEEQHLGRGRDLSQALSYAEPPTGNVVTPAEWTQLGGVLINIPLFDEDLDFYQGLVAGIIAGNAVPYIMVESQYAASEVDAWVLEPAGVSESQVSFVDISTDTFWSRDYGPLSIYVDGERQLVDTYYYPNRRYDDVVPVALAERWGDDIYTAPIYAEGGNFMTDGQGTCWTTYGTLWNNNLSESQVVSIYRSYLGCVHVIFVEPLPDEPTTHIDMFAKVLDVDTILVSKSTASLGASADERAVLDEAARVLRDSPKADGSSWNIVRVPMSFATTGGYWGEERVYFTHTNSTIVNDVVLVPTYGRSTDAQALAVYRDAMPETQVIGVDSISVIQMGGSVHCTTMQIPVKELHGCGDAVVRGSEQCDVGNLDGGSCATLGFSGGTLRCTESCRFDTNDCHNSGGGSACGNGVVESGEECDNESIACTQLIGDYVSGVADCTDDCSDWNVGDCRAASAMASESWSTSDTIVSGEWHDFEPTEVGSGTATITLSVDADADLYVKRGGLPDLDDYDCRPYLEGDATEICDLSGPGELHISVYGYDPVIHYALVIEVRE